MTEITAANTVSCIGVINPSPQHQITPLYFSVSPSRDWLQGPLWTQMIARPFIQASGDMSRSEHDPDMSRSEHDPTDFHNHGSVMGMGTLW